MIENIGLQTLCSGEKIVYYENYDPRAGDVEKTAIITPFCVYEFLCMPFGLCKEAQTFQHLIDELLKDTPYVFAYHDYILIVGHCHELHSALVCDLLTQLDFRPASNPGKCIFGKFSINFLGHQVT